MVNMDDFVELIVRLNSKTHWNELRNQFNTTIAKMEITKTKAKGCNKKKIIWQQKNCEDQFDADAEIPCVAFKNESVKSSKNARARIETEAKTTEQMYYDQRT